MKLIVLVVDVGMKPLECRWRKPSLIELTSFQPVIEKKSFSENVFWFYDKTIFESYII